MTASNLVKFGSYELNTLDDEGVRQLREMATEATPPRMKMLGQGNPGFVVGSDIFPDFNGILLYFRSANVMLVKKNPEDDKASIPVCWSWDGITPDVGSKELQSEKCYGCKQNRFGSDERGKGKRCKNTMRAFVLIEGTMLPVVWSVPPTSIKPFKKLLGLIMLKGIRYDRVVIKFKTHSEKSGEYNVSVCDFDIAGKLDATPEFEQFLTRVKTVIVPAFKASSEGRILAEEYVTGAEHDPLVEGEEVEPEKNTESAEVF
jgi:hypothetical protein